MHETKALTNKIWTRIDMSLVHRIQMSLIFWFLHLFPKSGLLLRLQNRINKSASLNLDARRSIYENIVLPLDVDRVENLDADIFYEKYVKTHTPVIFNGQALEWGCSKKWNLQSLKERHGSDSAMIVSRDGLVDQSELGNLSEKKEFSEKISVEQLVDAITKGEKKFLRFSPLLESNPELKSDLNHHWLKKMRHSFWGASYQTFIGPAGMKTPLHGGESTSFFYIMVDGEKIWDLIPAGYYSFLKSNTNGYGYNFSKINLNNIDENEFPGSSKMIRWKCHLKKGDVLYVPSWMWHEVQNLTPSWGISYRFISIRSMLLAKTFLFIRLFLTKPSIPKVIYLSFFKKNLPERDNHLLTPSLSRD